MTDKEIIKDFDEYTRNMRENCVIDEGVIQVSKGLWHQISDIIDALGADNKRLHQNLNEAHIDIKEKQAEIADEKAKKVICADVIRHQKEEIERLTNSGIRANSIDDWLKHCNELRAEAVKEFAERLCEGRVSNDPVVIAVKTELKFMEGGTK